MWNSISGVLTEKNDDFLCLKTGGVEWEIFASAYTLGQLPPPGEEVKLFTHLQHREDQMRLYGFYDRREREIFLELLKVGGVGAKQSLKILSGVSPEGFIRSLDQGDAEGLTRLPGLGLKTAQKIILSLRGKLTLTEEKEKNENSEIIDSLVNMGFERRQVKEAVKQAAAQGPDGPAGPGLPEEEIFRRALITLSRQGN